MLPAAGNTDQNQIRAELLELAKNHAAAQSIRTILFDPAFSTNIRHNSKVIREELARLAQRKFHDAI